MKHGGLPLDSAVDCVVATRNLPPSAEDSEPKRIGVCDVCDGHVTLPPANRCRAVGSIRCTSPSDVDSSFSSSFSLSCFSVFWLQVVNEKVNLISNSSTTKRSEERERERPLPSGYLRPSCHQLPPTWRSLVSRSRSIKQTKYVFSVLIATPVGPLPSIRLHFTPTPATFWLLASIRFPLTHRAFIDPAFTFLFTLSCFVSIRHYGNAEPHKKSSPPAKKKDLKAPPFPIPAHIDSQDLISYCFAPSSFHFFLPASPSSLLVE
jgi:hypothetical protein